MYQAKLLLVLDEIQGKELSTLLTELGYQVAGCVDDLQKVAGQIEALQPELVILGIQVGGDPGGISLGQKIYEKYNLPVIYASDQAGQTTIRRSGGTAPFGYIFKLNDERHVMATIEVALARHSLEHKLRDNERWLNNIVSCISEGLITIDLQERVSFMNPVAEALTGLERFQAMHRPLSSVLFLTRMGSDKRIELGDLQALSREKGARAGVEADLHHRDGSWLPVEIFATPLIHDDAPAGTVLAIRDIKERILSIEKIRRYAARSEALLRTAEIINSQLDVNTVLNTVCESCVKTLRCSAASAFLLDRSRKTLISHSHVQQSASGKLAANLPAFQKMFEIPLELISNLLSKAQPVITIQDIQSLDILGIPYLEEIKKNDVRSLAISGMYQEEQLIGILAVQYYGSLNAFSTEDLDLVRGLTHQASIAVGNSILFEQVIASRERQQALTHRLVSVQEEERKNLARELHDQIGQMLTGLKFSLRALQSKASDDQAVQITELQSLVSELIAQTREISLSLRPSMLDDIGLLQTLLWHFDRYTAQTGIKIHFHNYNIQDKPFQGDVDIAVFRIIQEALTNAARYAETDLVDVVLRLAENQILIEVSDRGKGFEIDKVDLASHVGLTSMRERAYAMGGYLNIQSIPGEGTSIRAVIPLEGKIERRRNERHNPDRG